MIHAYSELYLQKAKQTMASMFDTAVNQAGMELTDFYELFLDSDLPLRLEVGDSSLLAGHSGIELAEMVLERKIDVTPNFSRSIEYWLGTVLAHFQWETGLSFHEINKYVSVVEIASMYTPFHEMDISHFIDSLSTTINERRGATKLKRKRTDQGLSQSELATLSSIPVRTIQQYEQRQKNINKASAEYLISLSKALHCAPQDLLE